MRRAAGLVGKYQRWGFAIALLALAGIGYALFLSPGNVASYVKVVDADGARVTARNASFGDCLGSDDQSQLSCSLDIAGAMTDAQTMLDDLNGFSTPREMGDLNTKLRADLRAIIDSPGPNGGKVPQDSAATTAYLNGMNDLGKTVHDIDVKGA